MNHELEKAKEILSAGGYTCVVCLGETVFTSQARGVKPLLDWLDQGCILPGFSAADKVVGRATAFLYSLLGAKAVHAGVMSRSALDVLTACGIEASWDHLADHIRNRENTGMCPMEQATLDCQTPEEALTAIQTTLKRLTS